jgi:transcriptional regulator, tetR family
MPKSKAGPVPSEPDEPPASASPAGESERPRDAVATRLLECALDKIRERGLAVTVDHIGFEEVIKAAGVSRATAYRRWPSRQAFLSDVIAAAVQRVRLTPEGVDDVRALKGYLESTALDWADAQQRRNAVVALLHIAVQADFERTLGSTDTQTYYGLTATCRNMQDAEVRAAAQAALKSAAARMAGYRSRIYRLLPDRMGYRLAPGLDPDTGFDLMSDAAGAMMYGLTVTAYNDPGFATRTFPTAAWGSTEVEEWTAPAHHLVGLVLSYLQPDPDIVWDEDRIARVRGDIAELEAFVERMVREDWRK